MLCVVIEVKSIIDGNVTNVILWILEINTLWSDMLIDLYISITMLVLKDLNYVSVT